MTKQRTQKKVWYYNCQIKIQNRMAENQHFFFLEYVYNKTWFKDFRKPWYKNKIIFETLIPVLAYTVTMQGRRH